MDGLGNINWWGFSPSIDLIEEYFKNNEIKDELNILLVCSGDSRHIINTIASRSFEKVKGKKIRFFVYEKMLELYARHLILLEIAIQHPLRQSILY
jgi:dynein assembly factor 3, axonemal